MHKRTNNMIQYPVRSSEYEQFIQEGVVDALKSKNAAVQSYAKLGNQFIALETN